MTMNTNHSLASLVACTFAFVLALSAPNSFSAAPDNDPAVKHVDAKGAAALLKKDSEVVVLDIRTPAEYKDGHIAKAKNIDFYADDFEKKLSALDKSKTYLVHCASGGRSKRSLTAFNKLGFKSVVHLDGGYKGWAKDGQPVEK